MKLFSSPRFLVVYSGVLTLVFAVVVLCGAETAILLQLGIRR